MGRKKPRTGIRGFFFVSFRAGIPGWLLLYFLFNHLQIQAAIILARIESRKEIIKSTTDTSFLLPEWRKQRMYYNIKITANVSLLFHSKTQTNR